MSTTVFVKSGMVVIYLSTAIQGNVTYSVKDLERRKANNQATAKWETTRRTKNLTEYELAYETRYRARALVTAMGARSVFGYVAPKERRDDAQAAIDEAEKMVRGFNSKANDTRIQFTATIMAVDASDEKFLRDLREEIRGLLDDMRQGARDLDAKKIREAANRLNALRDVMSKEGALSVKGSLDLARKAARGMTKLAKAGKVAAIKVDREALKQIKATRDMFLDVNDEDFEVNATPAKGQAIDFDPDTTVASKKRTPKKASGIDLS
jgi:hypothetical protein